jgi:hypothetical protein
MEKAHCVLYRLYTDYLADLTGQLFFESQAFEQAVIVPGSYISFKITQ